MQNLFVLSAIITHLFPGILARHVQNASAHIDHLESRTAHGSCTGVYINTARPDEPYPSSSWFGFKPSNGPLDEQSVHYHYRLVFDNVDTNDQAVGQSLDQALRNAVNQVCPEWYQNVLSSTLKPVKGSSKQYQILLTTGNCPPPTIQIALRSFSALPLDCEVTHDRRGYVALDLTKTGWVRQIMPLDRLPITPGHSCSYCMQEGTAQRDNNDLINYPGPLYRTHCYKAPGNANADHQWHLDCVMAWASDRVGSKHRTECPICRVDLYPPHRPAPIGGPHETADLPWSPPGGP